MNFWIFFSLFIIFILLVKIYLVRGVYQAIKIKKWARIYAYFSIGSLVIGIAVLFISFSFRMTNLSFTQNFVTAFMVSIILCELLLAPIFLIDDIALVVRWAEHILRGHKKSNVPKESRRRFLKSIGLGLSMIPFTSFMYGITKGKYDFKVIRHTLTFSDLPKSFDGFKIVQFSDMHSGSFDSYHQVQRGFQLIQEQNSDIILFTGDLINSLEAEVIPYKHLLKKLTAPYGKYSILGNHDYPRQSARAFSSEKEGQKNLEALYKHYVDTDFNLLKNANVQIKKKKDFIRLIGVENWGQGFIQKGDLNKAIEHCANDEFSILMSHDPTHWEKVVLNHQKHIHLTLSGHTHGMQLGIEKWGMKWSPVKYFYKRWAGLYSELNQYLYVNRGFGFIGFAGRVGIRPEITVITLKTTQV